MAWKAPPPRGRQATCGAVPLPVRFGEPSCTMLNATGRFSRRVNESSGPALGLPPVRV